MVTSALQREVNARFGLLPNFFASAPDAPEIVEKLWDFAKSSYLDNPMPSLLKERLFVYLSRFCEIRYCIARHCAFLLGRGHASGDPSVSVQSIGQAIHLLKTPPPWARDTAMQCQRTARPARGPAASQPLCRTHQAALRSPWFRITIFDTRTRGDNWKPRLERVVVAD